MNIIENAHVVTVVIGALHESNSEIDKLRMALKSKKRSRRNGIKALSKAGKLGAEAGKRLKQALEMPI